MPIPKRSKFDLNHSRLAAAAEVPQATTLVDLAEQPEEHPAVDHHSMVLVAAFQGPRARTQ